MRLFATPLWYGPAMLHAATEIHLADTSWLQIGFVMCFTEPNVTIHRVEKTPGRPFENKESPSFDAAQIDAVIGALQKVREALASKT